MKFDELRQGQVFETDERLVTRTDIIDFARIYDGQPMHTDPEAAAAGPFGGVIASGFQTVALAWASWIGHGVMGGDGRGGISLERARWFAPVHADDRLRTRVELTEVRVTQKGRGLVGMWFEVRNQDDVLVLSFETTGLLARDPGLSREQHIERPPS